ncbi:hypothetical protein [Methylobacterium oxalidis]|uniref:hypothetical protein n=1 Tax=Methylobacterium oxalidis TaxID=944322 RepID=UPI00331544F1
MATATTVAAAVSAAVAAAMTPPSMTTTITTVPISPVAATMAVTAMATPVPAMMLCSGGAGSDEETGGHYDGSEDGGEDRPVAANVHWHSLLP